MYAYKVKKVMESLKRGIPIIVCDFETTGLKPKTDYFFQLAAIKMRIINNSFKVVDKKSILVKPPVALPEAVTQLTGFTNEMLDDKPSENEVFGEVKSFMEGSIFCSHNVPFDKGFMKNYYIRQGEKYEPVDEICTLEMSKDLYPNISHKLCDMANFLGVNEGESFHDARDDTKIACKILIRMLKEYNKKPEEKIKASLNSIERWDGFNHKQSRIYINTNLGTIYLSCWNKTLYPKDQRSNILSVVDLESLISDVYKKTGTSTKEELSKFKGSIKCY